MVELSTLWVPLLLTAIAGLSTVLGSFIACFFTSFKKKHLYFGLGLSAGVMVYISFVDLLGKAIFEIGFLYANIGFFVGIFFIMIIDFFVPHQYIAEKTRVKNGDMRRVGLFVAIGVAIHNFPEGLAVFVSSLSDLTIGVSLAIAIAVHNIPEGFAIAIPTYAATSSRRQAIWYSFLAGIAEPIGALVAILFLLPFLTPFVVSFLLAFVAGIMVFVSFDELLPLTYQKEQNHVSILGLMVGMIVVAFSLHLLS